MVSLEEQPLVNSFNKVFMGAAGTDAASSDDQFNRVSFLSHFEGSNNGVNNAFDDGSSSNHTITANGNVTQGSFGPFARPDGEWGVSFDGDDYLSVAETGADEFTFGTGDFTIEGWINNQAVDGSRTIVSTAQGNDFQGIWFGINGGNYYYIYNNSGSWSVIVDAGTPVVNAWTHFALVRNGTSNVVYINGSSIGSTTETARNLTNTNNLLAIGGRATVSQYTISTMSNVRVVKGTAVYTGNFTPSTSKLTAITNTKLLTCQSNRFVDNSASPLTITPVGNPAVTAFGPFLTSSVYDPAVNGASLFNSAASDYLSFGNIGLDGHSGDFSIEGWIYPTAFVASSNPLYTQGSAGGVSDLLEISLNSSGQPHAFINQGSITLQSTFVCPLNAWTFLQLKRTSGTLAIFTNGVQSSTVSNTATISSPNRGFVGAQSYDTSHADRSFYGFICDVRVSVVTRNVSLPTAPLAVTDSNTKLLLNMADGQAIDSAAQNNLTLIGNTDTSTGQAKFGNTSLFYDGSGDGAYYANGAALGTGDWTIETFLWVNDFNANLGVFQYGGADGALGSMVLTNQKIRVLSSNVAARLDTSGTINAQTWYHVAYVSYGGTLKVYINGTADSTTFDASSTTWTFTDTNIYVGARYYSSAVQLPFDGYLDEFRVSHFARYTSNFTAPTEPFPDKGQ
jgi:hypothetical protein